MHPGGPERQGYQWWLEVGIQPAGCQRHDCPQWLSGQLGVDGLHQAAEPDVLVKELAADEAIAAADTLLLTVPSQLGVDYNAHLLESVLTHVAPAIGWR